METNPLRSVAVESSHNTDSLVGDVMNSMEQGIIVWDHLGDCELHNARVFDVLELRESDLHTGIARSKFLQMAVERGEFTQEVADQAKSRFRKGEPFSFERLEEQQTLLQQLSLVAMHAKDIVAITDASGEIEWVNQAFSAALNYTLESAEGNSLLDMLCGENTDSASIKIIRDGMQSRYVVKTELFCYGNREISFWMELEVSPVFSESGEHTHFIAVGRDTTVRKTADLAAEEARKYEHRKRMEAKLLTEFSGWLQSTDSLGELFPIVSAFIQKLLPTSAGAVYVYANSRDVLEGVCHWNNSKMLTNFEPPDCWALRRGRSYYYGENEVDFPCHHVTESHGDEIPDCHYCLPILAHGDTVGLLCIELPKNSNTENELETQKLASFCGEQISLAIANVKLREQLLDQSTRDPLTSLYNRRYFIENVRRELNRHAESQPCSLISLDVDNFKKFNDNYGHDAGDTILREMSKILVDTFRGTDIPCRYGGEEFAIFLPGASAQIAIQRSEELRLAVQNSSVLYNGEELAITISLGISTRPENGSSIQSLIKSADRALYAAKHAGRNTAIHKNNLQEDANG